MGAFCGKRHAALFQSDRHAVETNPAKPVILIQNSDGFQTLLIDQIVDSCFDFGKISGAHIENIVVARVSEKTRPG